MQKITKGISYAHFTLYTPCADIACLSTDVPSMQAARAKAEEQAAGAKMDKKIAAAEKLVADLKKKAAELQVCNLLQCFCISQYAIAY